MVVGLFRKQLKIEDDDDDNNGGDGSEERKDVPRADLAKPEKDTKLGKNVPLTTFFN